MPKKISSPPLAHPRQSPTATATESGPIGQIGPISPIRLIRLIRLIGPIGLIGPIRPIGPRSLLKVFNAITPYSDFFVTFALSITLYSIIP